MHLPQHRFQCHRLPTLVCIGALFSGCGADSTLSPVPQGGDAGSVSSETTAGSGAPNGSSAPIHPTDPGVSPNQPPEVVEYLCPSDSMWTQGDKGSSKMHPGTDCNGCHTTDDGPIYGAAATVYDYRHTIDDCYGVPDVVVELIGANGTVIATKTNSAGNFGFSRKKTQTLTMPYTARVTIDGFTRTMDEPQTELNCAVCHTADGEQEALGRIVTP